MVVKKCERCGSLIEVNKGKEVAEIKCTHCNLKYEIDKKTKYTSYVLIGVIIFGLSFLISLISQLINVSPYILMIPVIIGAFFLSDLVFYLMAKFQRVSYVRKND